MIDGILPVDKPMGWTSHDVVGRVRRVAGQRQVGHAGTLDPLATGVLVLVLGRATRLSPYLMDSPKTYCAEIVLGATSVTDDAEAPLKAGAEVSHIRLADIAAVLPRFVGQIEQIPPAYAAIKRDGRKLYELARQGVEIAPVARRVTIYAIELLAWNQPRIRLRVRCGAGTYMRSLARDIGDLLGVGGYLHTLRRVSSGSFGITEAHVLRDLVDSKTIADVVLPLDRAVLGLPAVALNTTQERYIRHGRICALGGAGMGAVRLYGPSGNLVALGEKSGTTIRPICVFEGGESAHHA